MAFVEKYRNAFNELGLALSDDDGIRAPARKMETSGTVLPRALEDYYSVCGQHEVNQRQNRLLLPGDIYVADDRLVFMEEEQGAILWGVLPSKEADPEVWQGVKVVGDPQLYWYREELALSDFICAMWRWQITGEDPKREGSE